MTDKPFLSSIYIHTDSDMYIAWFTSLPRFTSPDLPPQDYSSSFQGTTVLALAVIVIQYNTEGYGD